jgi:RNA polymerase sigma factor (sigma-70 family)
MSPGDEDGENSLPDRIQKGDPAAEAELVAAYERKIRVMILARTGCVETARELTQEVLMGVLQSLRNGRLRDHASLGSFIHGTARNLLSGHFRSRARRVEVPLTGTDFMSMQADDSESAERLGLAHEAVQKLDPEDRTILLMMLVEGLKPGAVAKRLGLKSELVRQRKCRAVKRIRDTIRRRLSQ